MPKVKGDLRELNDSFQEESILPYFGDLKVNTKAARARMVYFFMPSLDITLRALCIFFIVLRNIYWLLSEFKANKEKPRRTSSTFIKQIQHLLVHFMWFLLVLQLAGLQLFAFSYNSFLQILGFMLFVIGIFISLLARHKLGTNWTHAGEYQIKVHHELITEGVYRYIRHPIYSGLLFSYVGGQLVTSSYLAPFFLIILFHLSYIQAKREEKLLLNHFGEKYVNYMKNSKMLIPHIV